MEQKLTITDITIISNLAEHMTDEQLAEVINKPVALIQMQFALMEGLPKRPWETTSLIAEAPVVPSAGEKKVNPLKPLIVGRKKSKANSEKKPSVKKNKPEKKMPEKKLHSAHAQAMERLKIRNERNEKSIYATRPLDLTGKVPIKLNDRTTVYVEPGANIEQLKKKYHIA